MNQLIKLTQLIQIIIFTNLEIEIFLPGGHLDIQI